MKSNFTAEPRVVILLTHFVARQAVRLLIYINASPLRAAAPDLQNIAPSASTVNRSGARGRPARRGALLRNHTPRCNLSAPEIRKTAPALLRTGSDVITVRIANIAELQCITIIGGGRPTRANIPVKSASVYRPEKVGRIQLTPVKSDKLVAFAKG